MLNFDLDTSVLNLKVNDLTDAWTIRNATEGLCVIGSTGSGKTSGSGRMIALKYLKAGFGGLILTCKADEKYLWVDYCKAAGRSQDLIVIEPNGKQFFNFLDYEAKRTDNSLSITDSLVNVLKTVIRAGEEQSGRRSDDAFWDKAQNMALYNVVDLCKLAYGKVALLDMYNIVQSVPRSLEEFSSEKDKSNAFSIAFASARDYANKKADLWQEGLDTDRLKAMLDNGTLDDETRRHVPEYRTLHYLDQFFFGNFIPLSEKTRSILEYSLSEFLYRLLREPFFTLFCSNESTVEPEDCLRGKIILLNLPVKIYDKAGRDCQILFKYIWQRAMERRNTRFGNRPVFLWADEAQNFLHEHDTDFQATARSSRVATVYLTQNLANLFANMGGEKSEHRVKSFLGTLNTKIFHANADTETNRYASDLIGDREFENQTEAKSWGMNSQNITTTRSSKMERAVLPEEFARLRTGGPRNDFIVEGYLHRQGQSFPNGRNHIKLKFNQKYNP